MARHNPPAVKHMLLGRTGEYVVRHAQIIVFSFHETLEVSNCGKDRDLAARADKAEVYPRQEMLSLSQARTRRVRAVCESFFVNKIEQRTLPHSALNCSWEVLFALLGGVLLIVVSLPAYLRAPPPALSSFPEARVPVSPLLFSFEDTVSYFSRTLGGAPRLRQNDYAFFETATSAETTLQIAVTRQGSQMLLRFRVEDEYGMDVVRNFCKAPFFQSEERDLLYALFSAGEGIHYAFMPRFYVLCEYDMRPERTLVSFLFSPPVQFCGVIPAGL